MNLQRLEEFTFESIKISSNLNNCKNKSWYKELLKLAKKVEEKIKNQSPAPPIENIDDIDEKFSRLLNKGNEELLRYILQNYPYNNYQFTEQSIEDYKRSKRKFLINLKKRYEANIYATNISINIKNLNAYNPAINNKIIEYINKIIDEIEKNR